MYGPQDRCSKRNLWEEIIAIKSSSSTPFCLMGDFNAIMHEGEKKGCHCDKGKADDFNLFVNRVNLSKISASELRSLLGLAKGVER